MEPNSGILTYSLQQFISQFRLGLGALKPDAISLLSLLCVLELTIAALWWGYSGNEALGKLIKKLLMFGFFIWVVENYDQLIQVVLRGFVESGTKAGGQPGVTNIMEDPSRIIDEGLVVVKPLLDLAIDLSTSWNLFDALFSFVSLLVIFTSFIVLAAQVFITRVEFALVSTLGLVLLPFGVFKQTAFMSEKVFGAVFTFGVKMMVLAFIVTVAFPLIQRYQFPVEFDWIHMLSLMATSITFAILSLRAPGVASAIISGSPSLGTAAIGAAAGIGAGIATSNSSAGSAMANGTGAVVSGIKAATGFGVGNSDNGSLSGEKQGGGKGGSESNNQIMRGGGQMAPSSPSVSANGSAGSNFATSKMKEEFADSLGKSSADPSQVSKAVNSSKTEDQKNPGIIQRTKDASKDRIGEAGKKLGEAGKAAVETIHSALLDEGQAGAGVNIPLRASNDD